jgi:putative ABC transport system permease protein
MVWTDQAAHDLRFAIRMFARNPGFSAAAILTLATGIGANVAIFSVVNAILLRPLPYDRPDRLVHIVENVPVQDGTTSVPRAVPAFDLGTLAAFRGETRTLSQVGVALSAVMTLSRPDGPTRLTGVRLSADSFPMLGGRPILGRTFTLDEDAAGADAVIVLSHSLWHQHFGGSPGILGQPVILDGRSYSVVGVMPRSFQYPNAQTQFWTPLALAATSPDLHTRATITARVRDDVSIDAAAQEVRSILSQLRPERAVTERTPTSTAAPPLPTQLGAVSGLPRFELISIQEQLVAPVRPALRVLTVAVALVLLIACVNVANLLLARTGARQRELAIRRAIGASPARLLRQALTESVALALAGGALGIAVAVGAIELLPMIGVSLPRQDLIAGVSVPRLDEVVIDTPVLIFSVALSVFTGLLFGLAPAARQALTNPMDTLRTDFTSAPGFNLFRRHRLQGILIVAEVTAAMMLLAGSGLLAVSFAKLSIVRRGYDAAGVLTFQVASPKHADRLAAFAEDLVARIRTLPGVRAAGYAGALPMVQTVGSVPLTRRPASGSNAPPIPMSSEFRLPPDRPNPRYVSREFLRVMGTRVIAGRDFDEKDSVGQQPVILINETVARSGVLGKEPIGHLVYAIGPKPWQVIGIVEDTRDLGLELEPNPQVFMNFSQLPGALGPDGIEQPYFAVRSDSDERRPTLVADIRGILREMDPDAMLDNVATMGQLVSNSVSRRRMYTVIFGSLAGCALVLAAVGIYGVIAYSVGQRTREIGIRVALGAHHRQIIGLVLGQTVILTVLGGVLGTAGAAAGTQYLEGMLFGVTPLDPSTFIGIWVVLACIAAAAAVMPAHRAVRIDPIRAIRCE